MGHKRKRSSFNEEDVNYLFCELKKIKKKVKKDRKHKRSRYVSSRSFRSSSTPRSYTPSRSRSSSKSRESRSRDASRYSNYSKFLVEFLPHGLTWTARLILEMRYVSILNLVEPIQRYRTNPVISLQEPYQRKGQVKMAVNMTEMLNQTRPKASKKTWRTKMPCRQYMKRS